MSRSDIEVFNRALSAFNALQPDEKTSFVLRLVDTLTGDNQYPVEYAAKLAKSIQDIGAQYARGQALHTQRRGILMKYTGR
jgi:hypothetical protein